MLNNNHKSCEFAEQTVSYLYGETAAVEKTEFESHLKTCPTCADELESFGFIRAAVLDWRNEDFAKLNTPVIDIPATKSKNVFSSTTNPTELRSWFGGLGKVFSFNPALAALAVLVVCLGAALFAFKFSGGEIAGNENDANLAQAVAVSPTAEATIRPEQRIGANEDSKISLPKIVKTDDSLRRTSREPQIVPIKSTVKASVKVSNDLPKTGMDNSARNAKDGKDNPKKVAPVKNQPVLNLNDLDDEDKTIRLADLFDELDAK